MPPHILLTIDVEDWFQVENFKEFIPYSSWPSRELRVEKNTHRLLDLLDEASDQRSAISDQPSIGSHQLSAISYQPEERGQKTEYRRQKTACNSHLTSVLSPQSSGCEPFALSAKSSESCKSCLETPKATFFVLGWLAERLPNLIREIHARGHEVASHGYHHELCSGQSQRDLEKDLCDSKKLLEDIVGEPVYGYRAPSFSISEDTLKSIEQCGYLYDSSYNSFAMHGRYGRISLNGNGRSGIAYMLSERFYELPISNLSFFLFSNLGNLGTLAHFRHFCLPWGGGGYFRLIPSWIFRKGVRRILSEQGGYLFYMHPWEIDPEQPRVKEAPRSFRFRHYVDLSGTEKKLINMLSDFSDCRFLTCHEYLKENA